jgi:nucleotide-binding universal stress UspA family protein
MIETIVVPSDFSKNASSALRYAIQLSKKMKSRQLIVFHCSHMSAYALSAASTEEQMSELIKEDEQNKLEKLRQQVKKTYQQLGIDKVPASTKCLVEFNPMVVENTIEVAEKYNAALIVMGTHGATGIKKFFFGSNTSIMISRSDIPVLAIPENFKYTGLDTISFASDLENIGEELKRLLPFVEALKARLNVVYLDYGLDSSNTKRKNAEAVIKKLPYKKIELSTQKATIETSLVDQVKKYLNKNKPDWLVMFTRERSLWDRLFLGSKTEDMSTALQVPLLTFKKLSTPA